MLDRISSGHPQPAQLQSLQVLRAVAALSIALWHALHDAEDLARRIGAPFSVGWKWPLEAGVDLFFVISGFVMVYASRDLFGSAASIGPFLRRRLARIVPIYWAVTILYLLLAFSALVPLNRARPDGYEILASFLFIPWQKADTAMIQPVYSLGWTLNYEMFFYLLFAFFLPLQRRIAVPLLVGIMMLLALVGHWVPQPLTQLHFWTRSIILEFGLGMVIAQMALSGIRPTRAQAAGLIATALGLLVLTVLYPGLFVDRVMTYGLPSALLVMAALAFQDLAEDGPMLRLLSRLGDASYAIYLLHPFVIRGVSVVAGPALTALSPWLFVGVVLVIASAVSLIVWAGFERPLTRRLQGPRKS